MTVPKSTLRRPVERTATCLGANPSARTVRTPSRALGGSDKRTRPSAAISPRSSLGSPPRPRSGSKSLRQLKRTSPCETPRPSLSVTCAVRLTWITRREGKLPDSGEGASDTAPPPPRESASSSAKNMTATPVRAAAIRIPAMTYRMENTLRERLDSGPSESIVYRRRLPMNTRFRRITLSLTLVLFATGSRAAAQDYQTHWKRAQKAMEAMKLEEAKRALRSALESLGSPPKSLEKAERIHALLSSVCEGTSQVAEALTHQEERLRLMERRLGAKHPDLMPALESAARLNRKLGRIPAALKQLERARALAEELPPKSRAPALERIYSELVRCRELAGDFDGLFEPLEAWIALIRQQRGPDHPDLVYPLTLQARALATLKRFEESVSVYKEWIRLQRLVWKGDHAGLARPLELLSFALLQLDRLDEASKVCDEWRGLLDRVMKDHPEIPRVLARRADIAEKRGRTDEVVKYLAEAVQRSQNNTAWRGSR
ncbi:MAG TPA: tetratricopeptide repeat protein, partial [Planctomycetes bacterium]|nr:tetratricopeptide repeat protein [Planctomycetota bacterium]